MGTKSKFLIAVAALLIGVASSVHAHELVSDMTGKVGLVFHTAPDDEPIAGTNSQLFFDVQDQTVLPKIEAAALSIGLGGEEGSAVPVKVQDNTVSADYTFARQGTYKLHLTVASGTTTYTFNHDQSVAASAVEKPAQEPSYPWALAAAGVALLGLLAIVVAVWLRRKKISA